MLLSYLTQIKLCNHHCWRVRRLTNQLNKKGAEVEPEVAEDGSTSSSEDEVVVDDSSCTSSTDTGLELCCALNSRRPDDDGSASSVSPNCSFRRRPLLCFPGLSSRRRSASSPSAALFAPPRSSSGLKLSSRNMSFSSRRYAGFSLSDGDARTFAGAAPPRPRGDRPPPSAELADRLRRNGCGSGIASRPISLATMQGLLPSGSGVERSPGASRWAAALPPAVCAQRRRRRKSSAKLDDDDASFAMEIAWRLCLPVSGGADRFVAAAVGFELGVEGKQKQSRGEEPASLRKRNRRKVMPVEQSNRGCRRLPLQFGVEQRFG